MKCALRQFPTIPHMHLLWLAEGLIVGRMWDSAGLPGAEAKPHCPAHKSQMHLTHFWSNCHITEDTSPIALEGSNFHCLGAIWLVCLYPLHLSSILA